jgi:hypothetical protein
LDALPGWSEAVFNLKVTDPELSVREWVINKSTVGKKTGIWAKIHEEVFSVSN